MAHTVALGIDIGGSGIKGAPVDLATGEFLQPRLKIATPAESTPAAVARIVDQIADEFTDDLPKDAGLVRMHWQVLDWNTDAIRFYDRFGANFSKEWLNGSLELEQLKNLAAQ